MLHIVVVYKASVVVHTEKLAEVERLIAVGVAFGELSKVECENAHAWQLFVWIWVAWVFVGILLFGVLLHDVVPGESGFFVVLVEQVEGSSRQVELFGFAFGNQAIDHLLSEFGLCAFVCFVDHQKVPLLCKNLVVFVEIAAHKLRSAQILNRGKIDDIFVRFQQFMYVVVAIVFRGVGKICVGLVENFAVVVEPTVVHHGSVCDDDGASKVHSSDHFECRERFSHAHFGVPEHFVFFAKHFYGFFDGFALLWSEIDGRLVVCYLLWVEATAPLFCRLNGFFCRFEVAHKPFVGFATAKLELFFLNARSQQNVVYALVVEIA